MKNSNEWNELIEEHELAHFRADLCLSSPESYTIAEKARICEEMDASAANIDAALKADFESLPPHAQVMLLDMLCASGSMAPEWWRDTLLGQMPNSPEELIMQGVSDGNPSKKEAQR